jgi:hypothetical protein
VSKSFATAVKEQSEEGTEDEGVLEFDLDGEPMVAFRPSGEAFAVLMMAASRRTEMGDAITYGMDFFYSCLDDNSAARIYKRLLDRKDEFGLPEVEEILEWMVHEWTGQSLPKASARTPSPRATGRPSKQTTRR